MTSLCGKAAACQRSRFIRIHAQNGFARLLQKAAEARNKARAGSAEGRKNARKEVQDGAASPTLEGIRRFMRLAFCPLVVRQSAALPCGKAATSLFRARPDSLCRRIGGKGCAIPSNGNAPVHSEFRFRRQSRVVFRRRSLNTKQIGRIGSQKRTFPAYTDDIRI